MSEDTRRRKDAYPLLIRLIRAVKGWSQVELGARSGLGNAQICRYEAEDNIIPSKKNLRRMVDAAGLNLEVLWLVVDVLHAGQGSRHAEPESPENIGEALRELLVRVSVLGWKQAPAPPIQDPQDEAAALWACLEPRLHWERIVSVEVAPEFHKMTLVVLVCEQSLRAAGNDPEQARQLADLAVRIAQLLAEKGAEGYALAHVGNAIRVGGQVPESAKVFKTAKRFWDFREGTQKLLLPARFLELEASLRRDERRFGEALELLDKAAALGGCATRNALKRAITYEHAGDYAQVAAILDREPPEGCQGRDLFAWRFNRAVNLCHLERYEEAAERFPEIEALARAQNKDLDLIRVVWLSGRIRGGLGDSQAAIVSLRQAQAKFLDEKIAFDAVLVSLELAVVLLHEGHLKEVRELSRLLPSLFHAQGLHDEAIAALRLFCEAVDRQTLSERLGRSLVAFFYRARYDKKLRFREG